ncbi:enterobactin transporter EntS [Nocardia alba]|uniref:enterobactin transporter EntS n=1 Tax=Nocardia alba TaxID=225051 RepID=UPI00083066AC|nr:enterobactin transporter EntS [Nocardia alba]
MVIDVGPLRTAPEFRLVLAAQAISMLGTHLTVVAVNLQVYQLTGSSLQVGAVGLVFGVALLIGILSGGVVADRADRRVIAVATRAAVVVVFVGLAVNAALPTPHLWVVYVAAVLAGGINGLGAPALMALVPALVGPERLAAAAALTALSIQVGAVIGPAMAGLIAAGPGLAVCFALDAVCFVISAVLLWLLAPVPPPDVAEDRRPIRSIVEGFSFVRRDRVVGGVLLIDTLAMVTAMPYALFPELASEHFGGGSQTVGLLYSAPAVGALLAALVSGWAGRVRDTGVVLIGAVLLWGVAISCVGLTASLWVALAALVVAGLADTTSEIVRRALIQQRTPDGLQGRVGSLWLAQGTLAPNVGNMAAGVLARSLSAPLVPVLGGVVCVVAVATLTVRMPGLRRARLSDPVDLRAVDADSRRVSDATAPDHLGGERI